VSDKLHVLPESQPWYNEGLRFECTGCGKCCTGAPGYTWVNAQEVQAIADYLKMPVDQFVRRYLRKVGKRYSLVEFKQNYDCVFLKDQRCSIYPVRPTQCRTFPWWAENLSSPEAWREAAKRCEGIRQQAPLVEEKTIQDQLDTQNAYVRTLED
jgi:Fe-S-cluster containining protein